MKLRVGPLTLKQANTLVAQWHRHHKPSIRHKFSIGCMADEKLVGACIVGRPVARMVDMTTTAEVARLVTDGTRNACSILYAAAARICAAMGYKKIQTYILDNEPGTSLKAAGWRFECLTTGGDWNRKGRGGRRTDQPLGRKQRWGRELNEYN